MPISEFDIIARYFTPASVGRDDVLVGVGDDGAVLQVPAGSALVVSTDTLVRDVHFSDDYSPEDIGYKALAVNLSDLAAMAAQPAWASLALTLPRADEGWIADFARGFFDVAEAHGVALVGGDLTRGPLTITVGVYGFAPTGLSLRRSGARPGDEIFVTGTLGDAALCLAGLPSPHRAYLETRLRRPTPRVAEGLSVRGLASGGIDISDGLAADLGHLLTQSGCGATVYLDRLPLSPALRALDDPDRRRALALAGGDDYELCFTVPPQQRPVLESRWRGAPITCIGRIESSPGLRWISADGSAYHPPREGYRHF
ncbi:MAG: thiamine-phosphate kinase [Gammaproteobacteria bacterium]|nr:thiamine-phosphate kinase [Gammaproteobacteria bacterium]